MTGFCRGRSYPTVYTPEKGQHLHPPLTAYQGQGLSPKGCPSCVLVCVCWCVGVCPWASMCVCVCSCVCIQCRVEGVQNTLCMWDVLKVLKCISYFNCCAFPHLMTAVCRLEEMQVLVSHCGTFFLTASFFHLLPLPLWTSGNEETSRPTIQCLPPPNQHLPPTSPRVVSHLFPTDRSRHIGELLNCTVHGTSLWWTPLGPDNCPHYFRGSHVRTYLYVAGPLCRHGHGHD